jgi:hypothetical protein
MKTMEMYSKTSFHQHRRKLDVEPLHLYLLLNPYAKERDGLEFAIMSSRVIALPTAVTHTNNVI